MKNNVLLLVSLKYTFFTHPIVAFQLREVLYKMMYLEKRQDNGNYNGAKNQERLVFTLTWELDF